MNIQKYIAMAFAILFLVAILYLATRVKKEQHDIELNFASIILGISLGWFTGILLSPYKHEITQFAKYGGVISAFMSGYFISKFDGLLTKLINPEILSEKVIVFRLMMSVTCFILAGIFTYVARTYPG